VRGAAGGGARRRYHPSCAISQQPEHESLPGKGIRVLVVRKQAPCNECAPAMRIPHIHANRIRVALRRTGRLRVTKAGGGIWVSTAGDDVLIKASKSTPDFIAQCVPCAASPHVPTSYTPSPMPHRPGALRRGWGAGAWEMRRVKEIVKTKQAPRKVLVKVSWYYRPEDTISGAKVGCSSPIAYHPPRPPTYPTCQALAHRHPKRPGYRGGLRAEVGQWTKPADTGGPNDRGRSKVAMHTGGRGRIAGARHTSSPPRGEARVSGRASALLGVAGHSLALLRLLLCGSIH